MLVLTRKMQQQIQIGDNITITVVRVTGKSVRIGISAPQDVRVMRSELAEEPQPMSRAAGLARKSKMVPPAGFPRLPAKPAEQPKNLDRGHEATPASRTPGASSAPLLRRAQRLGPAALRAFAGRA